MSLMDYTIRPKVPKEENTLDLAKISEKSMAAYLKVFFSQEEIQLKEIGCYFQVTGHRLLLKAVNLPEKTASGLIIPDSVRESMVAKYDLGLVIGCGPECYMDRERFPSGPRCKIGDWVDFSPMEKSKKYFNDHLCYFINDDKINTIILPDDLPTVVTELRKYT